MKRKTLLCGFLSGVTLVFFLSVAVFCDQKAFAQEQAEDMVYFIDGTVARGKIIHINRQIIQIRDNEGRMIERSTKQIHKFSSKRPFKEIYQNAVEEENRKF